jgi:hypothetical protein
VDVPGRLVFSCIGTFEVHCVTSQSVSTLTVKPLFVQLAVKAVLQMKSCDTSKEGKQLVPCWHQQILIALIE